MKRFIFICLTSLIVFTSCWDTDVCTYEYTIDTELYSSKGDTMRQSFHGTFDYHVLREKKTEHFFVVEIPSEGIKICRAYSMYSLEVRKYIPISMNFKIVNSNIKCIQRKPLN